jgi:hypothetical protein
MAHRIRPRRRHRAAARFFTVIAFVALAAASAGVALRQRGQATAPPDVDAATAAPAMPAPAGLLDASLPSVPERAMFPYSVVPGGVDSVDELRKAIATDAVVAGHYTGFDLSKARVERLDAPRIAHVSYRVGEHVYWTRKSMVLPAGERVITDGTHVARTRCGNQVADLPGATSLAEPAAAVLNTPTASTPSPGLSAPLRVSGITPPLAGKVAGGVGGAPGNSGSTGSSGFGSGGGGGSPSVGTAGTASTASFNPCAASPALCSPETPVGGTSDPGGTPGMPPGFPQPPFGLTPPFDLPPGGNPGDHPLVPQNYPGDPGDPPLVTLDPPGGGGPHIPGTPPDDPFVPPLDTPPGTDDDPVPPPHNEPATVPEPGSMLLMLTGAGGLLARRLSARRRG